MKRQPNPAYAAAPFECRFVDRDGNMMHLQRYPFRWKNAADADADFARICRGERPTRNVKPFIRTKQNQ